MGHFLQDIGLSAGGLGSLAGMGGGLGTDALISTLGMSGLPSGGAGGMGSLSGMLGAAGGGPGTDPLSQALIQSLQRQTTLAPWAALGPVGAVLLQSQLFPEFQPPAPAHSSAPGVMGPLQIGPNLAPPSPVQSYMQLLGAL